MANLIDTIQDYFPPASGVSIPLSSQIWMQFSGLMDEEELENNLFLEGPDTDQYIGPGLLELTSPINVSQGDLDDFLKSPGYRGIVDGTFAFETVTGVGETVTGVGTKVTFSPSHPLAPTYQYVVHLMETLDAEGNTVSGNFIWSFQTGTGSIQELPSSLSSSVLADLVEHGYVGLPSAEVLGIVSSNPADHSVNNPVDLDEIVITFDKALDPFSVTEDSVFVETLPVTDHPSATAVAQGEIITSLTVSGVELRIKL